MLEHTIQIDGFEGPLDLLLQLIEKRKLFINDISLQTVTDEYVAHIHTIDNFPKEELAQFILIASTLILIKSKSLLPELTLTEEEELSVQDLEKRLKLYKLIQGVSRKVSSQFGTQSIYFKKPRNTQKVRFAPDQYTTIPVLLSALQRVVQTLPKQTVLDTRSVEKVISLEEVMGNLVERLKKNLQTSFRNFSEGSDKVETIVSFLAMLELVKRGAIAVTQDREFTDITIKANEVRTPAY